MPELHIFTDGSVHTQSGIGYGACVTVMDLHQSPDGLRESVQLKRFEHTSSTQLELYTALWALGSLEAVNLSGVRVILYTDSQNLVHLPERRERLERNQYCNKKGQPLKNAEAYQAFYKLMDDIQFDLIKVKGHKSQSQKNKMDLLFTLVDQAARNAVRAMLGNSKV